MGLRPLNNIRLPGASNAPRGHIGAMRRIARIKRARPRGLAPGDLAPGIRRSAVARGDGSAGNCANGPTDDRARGAIPVVAVVIMMMAAVGDGAAENCTGN